MKIDSLFPSDYLKAADFPEPQVLQIRTITVEDIGQERQQKPVLHFEVLTKGLVLNKTNAGFIAHSYGSDTDNWIGRPVELHVEPVQFQGRVVDAIRARVPSRSTPTEAVQSIRTAANQPDAAPSTQEPIHNASNNDDIDF